MVSISTVALMDPVGNAERIPARRRRRRSTGALRGGSPSWADRNTGRCRGPAVPWRCERSRGRSRRASRTWARRRPACAARPGASRAGGRRARRASSLSLYCFCVAGSSKVMVRRIASRRLSWPSIRLSQVGVVESSKSAMKTLAPELSALMIILRSTGPVISTRRSSRSAGSGATVHSASRMCLVSGRKSGFSPASRRFWRSSRAASKFLAAPVESPVELRDELQGFRCQNPVVSRTERQQNFHSRHFRHFCHLLACSPACAFRFSPRMRQTRR